MLIRPPESLPRQTSPRRIAVRVRQKAVPAIRAGHPWLFEDSVKKAPPDAVPGEVAVLYDPDGKKILGAGLYDPHSHLRARILQKDPAQSSRNAPPMPPPSAQTPFPPKPRRSASPTAKATDSPGSSPTATPTRSS